MVYTYFTSFYKKIHDAFLPGANMVSSSSSLSSTCQNDSNRVTLYLGEINDSKWNESGTIFVKNNIILSVKNNIKKLTQFINDNLVPACSISINSLLPALKRMKEDDELLYKKKTELNSKRNRISYLQSHLPRKFETDEKGITNLSQDYIDAINAINALASEINILISFIRGLMHTLDSLKSTSDGYIANISSLGDEGISIPGYSAEREKLSEDLVPLDMANYPYIDESSSNETFQGGTMEKFETDFAGCRIYMPNGYKITPDTKLTVYLTGSGDRGGYFSDLTTAEDYASVKSFPKGPVLVIITDSFYGRNGYAYTKGNEGKLDFIISQAKLKLNITAPKISMVAYSAGNDAFAKYITVYSNNVDKAVLINPCGNALGHLNKPEFNVPYNNVGGVQIIQADRETKKHIKDSCYQLSEQLATSSNTSIAYFNGDHGDYTKVLSASYEAPTDVSRQLENYVSSTDAYIDPNFNIWDYVQ